MHFRIKPSQFKETSALRFTSLYWSVAKSVLVYTGTSRVGNRSDLSALPDLLSSLTQTPCFKRTMSINAYISNRLFVPSVFREKDRKPPRWNHLKHKQLLSIRMLSRIPSLHLPERGFYLQQSNNVMYCALGTDVRRGLRQNCNRKCKISHWKCTRFLKFLYITLPDAEFPNLG